MDKLQMAHDYAMQLVASPDYNDDMSLVEFVAHLWKYADAMQAEAEKRVNKERPDVLKEEWQPDWGQAPDNLVQYFAVDEDGRGGWFISKPTLCNDHWYWSDFEERIDNDHYDHAPSFDYQGNWKESLRKRPEVLCEVDWRQAPSDAAAYIKLTAWDIGAWIDDLGNQINDAPSFGFTGNHIVERPQ